jgi:multiple sugar transport system permease protein
MNRLGRSERIQPYVLTAPAMLMMAAVAAYPLVQAAWLSLHRFIFVFHDRRFVALDNYAFLFTDRRFWSALANTAYFTAAAVSSELALGLFFALLLNATFRGRAALRTAVIIPWAIPTVISAKLWAWFFDSGGLAGRLLGDPEMSWLGTPGYAMKAAIAVDVWKTTPFVALLLLAGLQSIPQDVYDAADVDGASRLRTFASITLPLLRPMIAIALIFRTLDAFRVFDAIYVLTEGGPANTTETLSIYAYKTLMRSGDFGYGATLSLATFGCVVLISLGYLKIFKPALGEAR